MVAVTGGRMQGGWEPASWLLTVIALLAVLQLHNMVGVAGTRMPRELLFQNCLKVWIVGIVCLGTVCLLDRNETSECIQEAARRTFPTPSYPILSPPTVHVSSHNPRVAPSK
ncbi:unnamed protein product [Sphagnum jensenii]|uniref:Uncharacterized protein n=1 Tax=Sphagnum jensenii TaxID=128206 RepID=A0ABP1BJC0_9BRYO